MTDYYDWNKTLSFDADVTMVVGSRGIGKTYGLRLQFMRDFLNHEYRFVELCRHASELGDFTANYFRRIEDNGEFELIYRTTKKTAYCAKPLSRKEKNKNEKPKWQVCGYFGALTQAQQMKKQTFSRVKRILLDEAIIDKRLDRYHRYLNNEYSILANIVDTVSRERGDENNGFISPRLYLLGNACDLLNPYFETYGVDSEPIEGYSWHRGKQMILHYLKDAEYARLKTENTVAGRMLANTLDGLIAAQNEFVKQNDDFVEKKPKHAKFAMGIVYQQFKFGIWEDSINGYYYVDSKIPKNTTAPIFSITAEDNRTNYIAARRMEVALRGFVDLYYAGIVRYENPVLQEKFIEVLNLYGVR